MDYKINLLPYSIFLSRGEMVSGIEKMRRTIKKVALKTANKTGVAGNDFDL